MSLQTQIDRQTRKILKHILRDMKIEPDSEVGKHVLKNFFPKWPFDAEVDEIYNEQNVFDWLCELDGVG